MEYVFTRVFLVLGVVVGLSVWRFLTAFTKKQYAVAGLLFGLFCLGNGLFPILCQHYSPHTEVQGSIASLRFENARLETRMAWDEIFISDGQQTIGPLYIFEFNTPASLKSIHSPDEVNVVFSTWDRALRYLVVVRGPEEGLAWRHDDRLLRSKLFVLIGLVFLTVNLRRILRADQQPAQEIPPAIDRADVLGLSKQSE